MSYRSTQSFAVGGVSYLNAFGEPGKVSDPVPTGWRCFSCNAHFWEWRQAMIHFGKPGERKRPICEEVTSDA